MTKYKSSILLEQKKLKTKAGLNIYEWRSIIKLCQKYQVNPKSKFFMDKIVRDAVVDDVPQITEKVRKIIFELDKQDR